MADIANREEKQILTYFGEGFNIAEICEYTSLRRSVASAVLARLCSYNKDKARRLVAEYDSGGPIPAVDPAVLAEAAAVPGTWVSVPVVQEPEPPAAPKKPTRPRKAAARPDVAVPPPSGPLVDPIEVPTSALKILGEKLDGLVVDAELVAAAAQPEPDRKVVVPLPVSSGERVREELLEFKRVEFNRVEFNRVAVAPRLAAAAVVADPETITSYVQWWCLDCHGQYGRPFRVHGAPARCAGELQRVLVTVTRLDGPP